MPLRYFKHKETGEIKRSFKSQDDNWEEVLVAPNSKFMETVDPITGKSRIKGLKAILTERARNHSRDVDLDDTIQINQNNQLGVAANLLNEKGEKRRKIDDI